MAAKPSEKKAKPRSSLDQLESCMAGEPGGLVDGVIAIRNLGLDSLDEVVEFLEPDRSLTVKQFDRLADSWLYFREHRKV